MDEKKKEKSSVAYFIGSMIGAAIVMTILIVIVFIMILVACLCVKGINWLV